MRILFVWTGVTSYMADCWRALGRLEGVELKVVVEPTPSGSSFDAASVFSGLDYVLSDDLSLASLREFRPDVIFAGGWRSANTRRVLAAFPYIPKVFCMDMPWRNSLRCVLARWALWSFMRKFGRIYVPGGWSEKYARWLGFAKDRISRGLYAVDFSRYEKSVGERIGFLYLGRYSVEKRLDLLAKAYARYRELGGTWSLDLYGAGELADSVVRTDGVRAHPFVQPDALPEVLLSHASLTMASAFDPWPLVILESSAAGMRVVASDRCGNAAELGADVVPFGDSEAMAKAMLRVEREWTEDRPQIGLKNALALRYDCAAWARRTLEIAAGMRRIRGFCPGLFEPTNGMAVVARMLTFDARFSGEYVVHGAWLPLGYLACLRHLGNFVRMPHGSFSPTYLKGSGKWKKRLVRPIERFLLRRAKKVLVTCAQEAEWVRRYEPLAKVELVDLRQYFNLSTPVSPLHSDKELRVLYLGRRHPLKGLDILERAIEGLPISLTVLSDVSGMEKELAWDRCDVLVQPSLCENFSLVVAEALSRGKPVIVTDGAPAWADEPRLDASGKTRLVYLDGYCAASPSEKVRFLSAALKGFLCS